MTAQPIWDQMFGQPAPPEPAASTEAKVVQILIAAGEEALTFLLTFAALFAVVLSIEKADWVSEMPSLGWAATIGLVSGWALGRSRVPEWKLHPAGIVVGAGVVLALVMGSMHLDPGTFGLHAEWSQLWGRNHAWFDALVQGNFSTDPLPFVLIVVLAAWLLAYLAAWAVVRWHNPWLALAPGGVALLTNISYLPGQPSGELILFLFAGILLFARMHLLRTVERGGAAPPPMLSLEVLHLATWVGVFLIVAAWIIPTANHWGPFARIWSDVLDPVSQRVDGIGRLFIGVGSKRSLGLHQFDSVLPLQGSVTLGDVPLLDIQANDAMYLGGAAYDQYVGNGWKQGATVDHPLAGSPVEVASAGTAQTRAELRQPESTSVHVDATITKQRLFTYGEPLASSVGARLISGGAPEDLLGLAPNNELASGDDYATVGTVTAAPLDRLVTASPDYPQWVRDRYLQLPADLPPDIRALAKQIAGDERGSYKLATLVEDYLRTNYTYTLDIGQRPPREDAVRYFLFDAKRGYSDYFASAMAVLLRALDVPSRVAVGFALETGDRDPATKGFHVTDQQSWVWPQVYFTGYGWVDFNPTPSRPLIARAGEDPSSATPVAGNASGDLSGVDPNQDLDVPALPAGANTTGNGQTGLGLFISRLGAGLLVASVVLVLLILSGRLAWLSAFRSLPPASQRWAKVQWLAARAGMGMRSDRTPLEEAAMMGGALARPPLDLGPLARGYVAERYGGKHYAETSEAAERMDQLYARVRSRLARRVVARFVHFWR